MIYEILGSTGQALLYLGAAALLIGVCVSLTDKLVPKVETVECPRCGDDRGFTFEEAVDHGWGRHIDWGLVCDECLGDCAAEPDPYEYAWAADERGEHDPTL